MNSEAQQLVDAGKLTTADAVKLSTLETGTYCLHKSWGASAVGTSCLTRSSSILKASQAMA
jgi:hypothetical protein